ADTETIIAKSIRQIDSADRSIRHRRRERHMSNRTRIGIAVAAALALTACSSGSGDGGSEGGGSGEVTVWAHQGQESEVNALQAAVDAFNESQEDYTATLQLVPEADYTSTVTTTSPDALPDVLEYDGPMMASLVYAGKLAPLGDLVAPETVENQTDSVLAQNTYPGDGELYGVSLGIYGNAALLEAAGVEYPTGLDDAWTVDEFEAALEALAAVDDDGQVLDIKENYGAEWPTYGFLPVVWSTGHDILVDNTADGNINHPDVVAAVERFAGWRSYIDPNTDDAA